MSENTQLKNDTYGRDQVVEIINSVIDKVQKTNPLPKELLANELLALKDIIEDARQEISATAPDDIQDVHIPIATDELDAVVGATEEATGTIMDCCDEIQKHMDKVDEAISTAVQNEVIKIFEACSFQDITGQRITKVIKTLQTIEEKVGRILQIVGREVPSGASAAVPVKEDVVKTGSPASLLNGPQMPDKAITQSDIDKLLAEFDN